MNLRPLNLGDIDRYVDYLDLHFAQSGAEGDPIYTSHNSSDRLEPAELARRARKRWTASTQSDEWRRTWGACDGDRIVGHAEITGASFEGERHRVELSVGVLRGHRSCGLGRGLTEFAIAWARKQPEFAWLDLGVFLPNAPAVALYQKLGFRETGRTTDRYRIAGHSLDELSMTLSVG